MCCKVLDSNVELSVVTVGRIYTECVLEVVICDVDVDLLPGNHIWRVNVASWKNN